MADKYINEVGLQAIKAWIEGKFALDSDLDELAAEVDELITEGGQPNVIEVVQQNGTALPVSNKTVNVTVPTDLSDLANAGQDPYATEGYVDQNGGKIDTISVNNTPQTITNKNVNITVPTATSGLTNDSDFQTGTDVQDAIDAALADITGIDFEVVQTLPATGEHGVIYLVPKTGGGGYDEYIWITPSGGTARFERIGDTDVDLSDYWTSTAGQSNSLIAMTTAEVNAILNPSA